MVYTAEKLIGDNAKVNEEAKKELQADIDSLKSAIQADDHDLIKAGTDKLLASQQKFAQSVYETTKDDPKEQVVDAEVVDEDSGSSK